MSASEHDSEADTAFTSADTIAHLTSMFQIAIGNKPTTVHRLIRSLPNGGEDIIEVPIYRRNAKLALSCLKWLGILVAKNGPGPIAQDAVDEKQQIEGVELWRKYQNGSHPSCEIGKKIPRANENLDPRDAPKKLGSR
jgi:hypothetical protein